LASPPVHPDGFREVASILATSLCVAVSAKAGLKKSKNKPLNS